MVVEDAREAVAEGGGVEWFVGGVDLVKEMKLLKLFVFRGRALAPTIPWHYILSFCYKGCFK